jgi:hypothetical protein
LALDRLPLDGYGTEDMNITLCRMVIGRWYGQEELEHSGVGDFSFCGIFQRP